MVDITPPWTCLKASASCLWEILILGWPSWKPEATAGEARPSWMAELQLTAQFTCQIEESCLGHMISLTLESSSPATMSLQPWWSQKKPPTEPSQPKEHCVISIKGHFKPSSLGMACHMVEDNWKIIFCFKMRYYENKNQGMWPVGRQEWEGLYRDCPGKPGGQCVL